MPFFPDAKQFTIDHSNFVDQSVTATGNNVVHVHSSSRTSSYNIFLSQTNFDEGDPDLDCRFYLMNLIFAKLSELLRF